LKYPASRGTRRGIVPSSHIFMWFSTIVLVVSLLGLAGLFCLKSLELTRDVSTPLRKISAVGDPLLRRGWSYGSAKLRLFAFTSLRVGIISIRTAIHTAEARFDASMHALAARLNKYLRTRRLHIRHGSEVSTHLKAVLEKTEQKTEESNSR